MINLWHNDIPKPKHFRVILVFLLIIVDILVFFLELIGYNIIEALNKLSEIKFIQLLNNFVAYIFIKTFLYFFLQLFHIFLLQLKFFARKNCLLNLFLNQMLILTVLGPESLIELILNFGFNIEIIRTVWLLLGFVDSFRHLLFICRRRINFFHFILW